MNVWQSVLLGLIQGIAEFLPISSSGHLVIFQNWLQINPPPFYFDVFIHLVSLAAIVIYFRKQILKLKKNQIGSIVAGTVPIIIVGWLFQKQIQTIFGSSLIAGAGLLLTAIFNFKAASNYEKEVATHSEIDKKQATIIGLFQTLAIVPGISRSGSTIFGASLNKISKKSAFEFSFLLAIPAIMGANVVQLFSISDQNKLIISSIPWSIYLLGGAVCFIVSLLSLKLLKRTLNNHGYKLFGWYCLLMGLTVILSSLLAR